ncbi:RNA-directed DNA polymerase, eukaryota [Tanacetum coccineum]
MHHQVAIEGLPVKALTRNTYAKIVASWGKLIDINESDNCSLSCIRVCVRTKPHVLINDRVKIIIKGQLHRIYFKEQEAWMPEFKTVMEDDPSSDEESEGNNENDRRSDNEHVSEMSFAHENVDEFQVNPKPSCNTVISEDPFGIYKILKRNKDANVTEGDTHTPQYLPGFTSNVEENVVDNIPGNTSQPKPNPTTSGNKEKASSDLTERSMLWDFIHHLIDSWDAECVLLGDFNVVRFKHKRPGSLFNSHGANSFNNFITRTDLIDLSLEGYSFTWAHKSASKMSKLDRFLISEGLLALFPSISALFLDKHFSDHRPILLYELNIDYGPTPFRFFHSWSSRKGFDNMVEDSWNNSDLNKSSMLDMAQKAKIRWAIEGDENSKFFHGIINKKRSQLAIHEF